MPSLFRTAGFPLGGQSHGGPAFSSPRSGVVTSIALLVFGGRPNFRPCGTRAFGESPLVGLMPCGPVSAHHFSEFLGLVVHFRTVPQAAAGSGKET